MTEDRSDPYRPKPPLTSCHSGQSTILAGRCFVWVSRAVEESAAGPDPSTERSLSRQPRNAWRPLTDEQGLIPTALIDREAATVRLAQ
jgi:hypothetical protein